MVVTRNFGVGCQGQHTINLFARDTPCCFATPENDGLNQSQPHHSVTKIQHTTLRNFFSKFFVATIIKIGSQKSGSLKIKL